MGSHQVLGVISLPVAVEVQLEFVIPLGYLRLRLVRMVVRVAVRVQVTQYRSVQQEALEYRVLDSAAA
jgi:hypothetical protein